MLLEPLFSDFRTKLTCSTKLSYGLIKLSANNEITYIEKIKHDSEIDILIEPFKANGDRLFLFIYKSEQSKLGMC